MNVNALIVLIIAIALLWLAVTDKLSRFLDAYDVVTGKKSAQDVAGNLTGAVASAVSGTPVFQLPTLPKIALNAQVPA